MVFPPAGSTAKVPDDSGWNADWERQGQGRRQPNPPPPRLRSRQETGPQNVIRMGNSLSQKAVGLEVAVPEFEFSRCPKPPHRERLNHLLLGFSLVLYGMDEGEETASVLQQTRLVGRFMFPALRFSLPDP